MKEQRNSTLHDVAREADVSIATASRVISNRGYVSKSARQRVEEAIARLDYKVHGIARGLKRKNSNTVGLMIADIANSFYATLADGVLTRANELGYKVILSATNEMSPMEWEYIEVFMEERVAGVLAVPTANSEKNWEKIVDFGTKVVFIDRELSSQLKLDCAIVDNEGGVFTAIKYLIELGHRRIGFINGPISLTTGQQRYMGYLKAIHEAGLELDADLVKSASFRGESGYKAAKDLLSLKAAKPTAIFAANNVLGEGVFSAIREYNLTVPNDLSLIVFDDVSWTRLATPQVTVVRQPTFQLGYEALSLLHQRLEEQRRDEETQPPRSIILKTELLVRESCSQPQRF